MKLKVTIAFLEHAKIMHWVKKAGPLEVSGFGRVLRQGSHLHVCKVYLLEQTNTAGSTVLDAADLSRALYVTRDDPGDFNFWWHSHHSMAAFFSGTDHDTIKDLGSNGWLLATCFNNRGETKTGLYTTVPVEILHEDKVEIEVDAPLLPQALITALDEEYDLKVEESFFKFRWTQHAQETRKERKARQRLERLREANTTPTSLVLPSSAADDDDDEAYTDEQMAKYLEGGYGHGYEC